MQNDERSDHNRASSFYKRHNGERKMLCPELLCSVWQTGIQTGCSAWQTADQSWQTSLGHLLTPNLLHLLHIYIYLSIWTKIFIFISVSMFVSVPMSVSLSMVNGYVQVHVDIHIFNCSRDQVRWGLRTLVILILILKKVEGLWTMVTDHCIAQSSGDRWLKVGTDVRLKDWNQVLLHPPPLPKASSPLPPKYQLSYTC